MPPFKSQELTYSFNLSIMVYFIICNSNQKYSIFLKSFLFFTPFFILVFLVLYTTLLSKRLIYHHSLGGNPNLIKRLLCKYIIVRK